MATARWKESMRNTWLPMWAWMPTSSTESAARARCTASAAAPEDTVKPNLESSRPVER